MKKQHLLAAAILCTAVSCLATPVSAMVTADNDPVHFTHRETVRDHSPMVSGKQAIGNDSVFSEISGMSDEAWLLCSALLGLAGIVIVYRTAH